MAGDIPHRIECRGSQTPAVDVFSIPGYDELSAKVFDALYGIDRKDFHPISDGWIPGPNGGAYDAVSFDRICRKENYWVWSSGFVFRPATNLGPRTGEELHFDPRDRDKSDYIADQKRIHDLLKSVSAQNWNGEAMYLLGAFSPAIPTLEVNPLYRDLVGASFRDYFAAMAPASSQLENGAEILLSGFVVLKDSDGEAKFRAFREDLEAAGVNSKAFAHLLTAASAYFRASAKLKGALASSPLQYPQDAGNEFKSCFKTLSEINPNHLTARQRMLWDRFGLLVKTLESTFQGQCWALQDNSVWDNAKKSCEVCPPGTVSNHSRSACEQSATAAARPPRRPAGPRPAAKAKAKPLPKPPKPPPPPPPEPAPRPAPVRRPAPKPAGDDDWGVTNPYK